MNIKSFDSIGFSQSNEYDSMFDNEKYINKMINNDNPVPLKFKHKNRVKKIKYMPEKFKQLDEIVKQKYQEFEKGKKTYTLCYLDEENELINISDDEDYTVFKDHVKNSDFALAKVFLTKRGEESLFNPQIDDAQTIHESVIPDNEIRNLRSIRSSVASSYALNSSRVSNHLLEQINTKLGELLNTSRAENFAKPKKWKKKNKQKKCKKKCKAAKKLKDRKEDDEISKRVFGDDTETEIFVKDEKKEEKKSEVVEETTNNQDISDVFDDHDRKSEYAKVLNETVLTSDVGSKNDDYNATDEMKPLINQKESKHEHSIQPALNNDQQKEEKETIGSNCKICLVDLVDKTRYVSSISTDFYICEKCESTTDHEYAFIKLKQGVSLNPETYDQFCQNMLLSYSVLPENYFEKVATKMVKMNTNKAQHKKLNIKPYNVKMAQRITKGDFGDNLVAKRGFEVDIKWEVKNFTAKQWSDKVFIECLPTSDIILPKRKVKDCLNRLEKCEIDVKFILPKDTLGRNTLEVNFCLFDQESKTYFGEELKAEIILV